MNTKNLFAKLGPFLGLLLVIGLFSISPEVRGYFLTYANFKIILTQTVVVAIGALGMTLIIVSGGIDLSVGSGIAFTGVVGALLIQHGWPVPAIVVAVIASGAGLGFLNGTMIAGLKMMPFIITLGMLSVIRGAAQLLGGNETVNYDTSVINTWMTTPNPRGWALPAGAWIAVVAAIGTAVLLRHTVFGRHIFAIGSNEATARLCGVPTMRTKILIYTVGGAFIGLAGLMQLSRLRQ
ncbi:MAG: ABC transporter permease, partial [Opitutaceae bacterium]